MKKINFGLIALALTFGIVGAFATNAPKAPKHAITSLYWYPVNSATNKTSGPYEFDDSKANVIEEQPCQDQVSPICLFGSTSSSLPTGTPVGSPSAADRILEAN